MSSANLAVGVRACLPTMSSADLAARYDIDVIVPI